MAEQTWWGRVAVGAWKEARSQLLSAGLSLLTPWVGAAVTFLTGLVQIPVAYALAAASIVFAAISFGSFFFYNLLFQRSPEGKLVPVSPQVGVKLTDDRRSVESVTLGMVLHNSATFPIEYRVIEANPVVNDTTTNPSRQPVGAVIYPNFDGSFATDHISLKGEDLTRPLEGRMSATIEFGRPGKRVLTMKKAFKITFNVKHRLADETGNAAAASPPESDRIDWSHDD